MARPYSDGPTLDVMVGTRLTRDEMNALVAFAAARQLKLSAAVRMCVQNEVVGPCQPQPHTEGVEMEMAR